MKAVSSFDADFYSPVVNQEAQKEIYRLGKQLARCLTVNGMLNSEVRIDTLGVRVLSIDCNRPFNDADEAEIFLEPESRA